jgi:hypothetical protein
VTEKAHQLLYFLGCFALWVVASFVVFQLLAMTSPIYLYISALVGFMLVAEYFEPALSEAGFRGGVWAVTFVGFAVFFVWMAQWILAELQAMLGQVS